MKIRGREHDLKVVVTVSERLKGKQIKKSLSVTIEETTAEEVLSMIKWGAENYGNRAG